MASLFRRLIDVLVGAAASSHQNVGGVIVYIAVLDTPKINVVAQKLNSPKF